MGKLKFAFAFTLVMLVGCDYQQDIDDLLKESKAQNTGTVPPSEYNPIIVPPVDIPSSSAAVIQTPTPTPTPTPTATSVVAKITGCTWIWDASLKGAPAAGYQMATEWYSYSDEDDTNGGSSQFSWIVDNDSGFKKMVATYGEIAGLISLGSQRVPTPYAGVGMNVNVPNVAAKYSGICAAYAYTGDVPMLLELVPAQPENLTGYDNPVASLTKSSNMVVKKIKWSSFDQEGWGYTANTYEILDELNSIQFKFWDKTGKSRGKTSDFEIFALGFMN